MREASAARREGGDKVCDEGLKQVVPYLLTYVLKTDHLTDP